jgi:hypothetical protein
MELFTSGRQTHGLQNSGLHPTVMCLYVIRSSLENLHFKHSTLCICYISITIFYDHLWKGLVVVVVVVVVKLLPCDQEVMGSSPENSLLQKCRERLRKKTQVVGPFPGPCASGSYVHRAALFLEYFSRKNKNELDCWSALLLSEEGISSSLCFIDYLSL